MIYQTVYFAIHLKAQNAHQCRNSENRTLNKQKGWKVPRIPDPKMRALIIQACQANDGWLRQSALGRVGIHSRWITRLIEDGTITRVRKGLYRLTAVTEAAPKTGQLAISGMTGVQVRTGGVITENDLLDACRAIPQGVVCLGSALAYHGLISNYPGEVFMAMPKHMWVPKVLYPPMRVFRFSEKMLETGLLEKRVGKRLLVIFDAEKSICDCLRLRKVIGQEIAIEGLRNYLSRSNKDLEKLVRMGRDCRVEAKLKTYLEVLLVP
jgi:predicted transcriptional regulator of viral defense system